MESRKLYFMTSVFFLISIYWFILGYNGASMPSMLACVVFFGIPVLTLGVAAYSFKTMRLRVLWACIFFALVVMCIFGLTMLNGRTEMMDAPQSFLKWGCISFVIIGVQVATIPTFINRSSVYGLILLFVEALVGMVFFCGMKETHPAVLDNPFVTKEFFWCTGGLFALFMFELGIAITRYGVRVFRKKEQPVTEEEANHFKETFVTPEEVVDIPELDLLGQNVGMRLSDVTLMANNDAKPMDNRGLGSFLVFVGVIIIALSPFIAYCGLNYY